MSGLMERLKAVKAMQKAAATPTAPEKPKVNNAKPTEPNATSNKVPATNDAYKSRYSSVNNVTLSLKHKVNQWDDDHVTKLKVYKVARLSEDSAVTYGKALVNSLNEGVVDANTLNIMLRLAVSLKSLEDPQNHLLADPSGLVEKTMDLNDAVIDDNIAGGDEEDDDAQAVIAAMRARRRRTAEQRVAEHTSQIGGDNRVPIVDVSEDEKEFQSAAYCFLAAYLMRLQCRQADKTHDNLQSMIARYGGFYDKGETTLKTLSVTVETLESIRGIVARKPEIISTWVLWLAFNENDNDKITTQEMGMLEYIGLQIFSYQGMHAVTQVLALRQIAKIPLGDLLFQLSCQMTRSAVDEIYRIVKDYETTDNHPDRKTYFRYARVWSPGYFMKVQSKECPQLVYLAAKTVKELSPNLQSDPTKIYACQNLGQAMKEKLDSVSDNLVHYILSRSTADKEAGDVWK